MIKTINNTFEFIIIHLMKVKKCVKNPIEFFLFSVLVYSLSKPFYKMDSIFVIAGVITIIFFVSKFIEMRFIEKENKPLKFLIRDSLLVYVSVMIGYFVLSQLHPIIHGGNETSGETPLVFTDNPEF